MCSISNKSPSSSNIFSPKFPNNFAIEEVSGVTLPTAPLCSHNAEILNFNVSYTIAFCKRY